MSLEQVLRRHQVVSTKELLPVLKNRVQIRRRAEAGEITPLARGIYASPHLDPFVGVVFAAARFYPDAVISNITALHIHGLSDERIDFVDVDIPRERSIRNSLLRVHRVPKGRVTGVTSMKYHGTRIRIYDLERALCEAYLLDPAGPIFFKALKRYLKDHKPRTDLIKKYDAALRTEVLMHLQQELASD